VARPSTNGPVWNPDPQRREFKNLHTTVERLIKGLEGLTEENQSEVDDEIQSRTPWRAGLDFIVDLRLVFFGQAFQAFYQALDGRM
jgi:hypothetical protein